MEEINIYKNLNNINTLKSDESVKKTISRICEDILEYTKADGISIYIYNKREYSLTPFIELGLSKKYSKIFSKTNIMEKELEIINLRGIKLHPLERIENYANSNINKYNEFEISNDNNIFESYKLSVDYEFIGALNIIYKPKNVYKNLPSDFIEGVCKLISIIIRSWFLNKEVIMGNQRRTIIENELDEYLEKSTDLIFIHNDKGELINLSSNWTKILGWGKEELLNSNIYENIHFEDENIIRELYDNLNNIKIKENRSGSAKTRHLCKDGTYKWIYWNVDYSVKLDAYFVIGKDITEKIIEEEKQKNLEEKIKLESMRSDFFADLSHEFKTPLNIILGTMQVMEKFSKNNGGIPSDDLYRYLKNIKQNSYRLLKLVNNVTDISKMDNGYSQLSLSENNIVNIIEDICLSVVEYAKNKGIDIIFDTDCEEIVIACDPEAIERIVLNLLSNAIKYSSDDEGKILVNIKNDEEFVFVSVKDNGKGIPKDKLEIIFDRFGQANADFKSKCEGCGIGLYLVQSLVKLHGGSIKVESEENEGSIFIFNLSKNLKVNNEIQDTPSMSEKNNFNIEKYKIEFSDIYN